MSQSLRALVRHGLTAIAVSLCSVMPVAGHAQDLGMIVSDAAPAALRCPGRALPDVSHEWLFDQTWVTFNASDVEMQMPVGIALDTHCNVYVADRGRAQILKLNQNGELVDTWGDPGTFTRLGSIAVDPNDNLFVADLDTRRVLKLDTRGQVQLTWAVSCTGISPACVEVANSTFENLAVATDGFGRLYILANEDVLQLSGDGPLLARWSGRGPAHLKTPSAVGIDASGNVFVADAGNGRVQKLSSGGQVLATFTTQASRQGQPSPALLGLAIDRGGNLFMANDALAVDGQGNRFLADPARGRVVAALNVAVPAQSSNLAD